MAFLTATTLSPSLRTSAANATLRAPRRGFITAPIAPRRTPTRLRSRPRQHSRPASMSMTPPAVPLAAGVGTSTAPDTATAVREAVAAATASLPGPPAVALVTATVSHTGGGGGAASLPSLLAAALPGTAIHGATTCAAVLSNAAPLGSPALSVLALHTAAPGALAVAHQAGPASASSGAAAAMVAAAVADLRAGLAGRDPAHVLLHTTPGAEEAVLAALREQLPAVPVFGGSAADDAVAGDWRLIAGDALAPEGLSLLGVAPGVRFGAALVPPYEPTATRATVTRATGRVVHELDGRRAGDVLREWVGEPIAKQATDGGGVIVECAAFPLGVERAGPGGWVGVHAAEITPDGAVGLFAEVVEGDVVTVMRNSGGGDSAAAAAIGLDAAYKKACDVGGLTNPKAGLLIYCGGLSIAVGDALASSLSGLVDKPPLLGITAFGEQGNVNGENVHSNLAVGLALFE